MPCEIIDYGDFQLHLDQQGAGLKAAIWRHGLYFVRPDIPYLPDMSLREQLIAEAKALVDTMFTPGRRRDGEHPNAD